MGEVILLPKNITMEAYGIVFKTRTIWVAYLNTIFYTVFGTAVNMLLTILGAYALSKKKLPGRRFLNLFVMLTMWIHPGVIPTYLNFLELRLLDTRASILIGFAINVFNFVLLRTFFESVPDSMEEVAKIDGANDMQILWSVYIPLSVSAIATITLFYAVGRWNSYFWAMILFRSDSKVPLQVLLKKLVVDVTKTASEGAGDIGRSSVRETVIYSTMVVSMLPMIIIYPFIQKFFVKGIMVGAIKG
jgi:ABC-type sugar transport system, permease component